MCWPSTGGASGAGWTLQFNFLCDADNVRPIHDALADEPDFYPPEDLDGVYRLNDHEKAIINPGSVGQPRDMDPRALFRSFKEEKGGEA